MLGNLEKILTLLEGLNATESCSEVISLLLDQVGMLEAQIPQLKSEERDEGINKLKTVISSLNFHKDKLEEAMKVKGRAKEANKKYNLQSFNT